MSPKIGDKVKYSMSIVLQFLVLINQFANSYYDNGIAFCASDCPTYRRGTKYYCYFDVTRINIFLLIIKEMEYVTKLVI